MDDYKEKFTRTILDVTQAAGYKLDKSNFEILTGHNHINLKKNQTAVYIFCFNEEFLKIGKAGSKSLARINSHHYGTSTKSTLAKSIKEDKVFQTENGINDSITDFGKWIKANTTKYVIIFDYDNKFTNALIESAFHYKFKPKYEN